MVNPLGFIILNFQGILGSILGIIAYFSYSIKPKKMNNCRFVLKLVLFFTFFLLTKYSFSQQILNVSEDKKYLKTADGKPFFWLGDTAWLLFSKLTKEETITYLNDRNAKGYNVIQVMVLHSMEAKNAYGKTALINGNAGSPIIEEDGYWSHIDFVINEAKKRGMYVALVPVWGSNVKAKKVTVEEAKKYGVFLSDRYGKYSNVIWLNGGDQKGNVGKEIWETLGETLRKNTANQLITYHPYGRHSSADWFHDANWLDFNMFQSGHKTYAQDTVKTDLHRFGEDNWRFVLNAKSKQPLKPILDGEPSYEGIPHGLHDTTQTYFTANDVRRYAWWSVFEGSFGHTYGHSAIMQFYSKKKNEDRAYGVRTTWTEALNAPGSAQMQYLKNFIVSIPNYEKRTLATDKITNQGERYNRISAFETDNHFVAYTYSGREIKLNTTLFKKKKRSGYWYNPENGNSIPFAQKSLNFTPPTREGATDWTLVINK